MITNKDLYMIEEGFPEAEKKYGGVECFSINEI
jgi:hypothetical protein